MRINNYDEKKIITNKYGYKYYKYSNKLYRIKEQTKMYLILKEE